jgi:hypothetical protein
MKDRILAMLRPVVLLPFPEFGAQVSVKFCKPKHPSLTLKNSERFLTLSVKEVGSQVWGCMPAFRRLRQEDHESEVSVSDIVKPWRDQEGGREIEIERQKYNLLSLGAEVTN